MVGRNPDWTFEEAVLLHALYRRSPQAGRDAAAVLQLSNLLNETAAIRNVTPSETYRNPTGVAMRLRNISSIDPAHLARELRGLPGGPRIDKVVWARFAEDPVGLAIEEARILALWSASAPTLPAPSSGPSRGPAPQFGDYAGTRKDGPTSVYLLKLAGPRSHLLAIDDSRPLLKLGLSNQIDRRLRELNAGFPTPLGVAWTLVQEWTCPDGVSAWAVERAALTACHKEGWSLGGEFVRCEVDAAAAMVAAALGSSDRAD